MKKLIILVFTLFIMTLSSALHAQKLISDIAGKWSITKYQSKIKTQGKSGTVEFLPDGTFRSEGIHFGTQKGLFRTDETRSVVIIDTPVGISEWNASIKNDILRLRSVKGKGSKIYLTLLRMKDDVSQ